MKLGRYEYSSYNYNYDYNHHNYHNYECRDWNKRIHRDSGFAYFNGLFGYQATGKRQWWSPTKIPK